MAEKTTIEFLEAVKRRHGVTSDYAVAKLLGVSRQQVSKYRRAGDAFSDLVAVRVAELLELDFVEVIAARNAQRARTPAERQYWRDFGKKAAGAIAGLAIVQIALWLLGVDGGVNQGLAMIMAAIPAMDYAQLTFIAVWLALLAALQASSPRGRGLGAPRPPAPQIAFKRVAGVGLIEVLLVLAIVSFVASLASAP